VTSSIRRPVSADVTVHVGGSLSPARHPTGTQRHHARDDNTTSTSPGPGIRPLQEVTSRPPCCDHVTSVASRPLPVVDEGDAIQSSVTTSSERCRSIGSRPLGDVTDHQVSLPSTSFPHLGHVTGSDFAAWCPATLLAFAAALQRRSTTTPSANMPAPHAISAGTSLPSQPDLRRAITVEDVARLIAHRPKRSIGARILPTPVLPLFRAPATRPPPHPRRQIPADEPSQDAVQGLDDTGLPTDHDMLFDSRRSTRTLAPVGGLDVSPALSMWSLLLAGEPPRHSIAHHPAVALTDLPYHHTHAGQQ